MTSRVYIDGHAGTTGLRIREWLRKRDDLQLVTLPEARRKDPEARLEQILAADVALLCLPDRAAREVVARADETASARLLDTSTAHRTETNWIYGLPELDAGRREAIARAERVSNPGCYPSAFLLLVRPLIDAGLLPADVPLVIHALSGYSGGGRPLIEKWEDAENGLGSLPFEAPYAFDRLHKHVGEMRAYSGLSREPVFLPAVGPFRCGMRVQVPLHAQWLAACRCDGDARGKTIHEVLAERYRNEPFVRVAPLSPASNSPERRFDPRAQNDSNRIALHVAPHASGHVLLVAILDNLGKGAAGVAIQNLNLMLGRKESTGLPSESA